MWGQKLTGGIGRRRQPQEAEDGGPGPQEGEAPGRSREAGEETQELEDAAAEEKDTSEERN